MVDDPIVIRSHVKKNFFSKHVNVVSLLYVDFYTERGINRMI